MNDINANVENCLNSLDTYIDVLRKESAKLSGMIEKLNNKIKEVEATKEQLIKEQNEPKFEITQDEKYYFVAFNSRGCNLAVTSDVYVNVWADKDRVAQNNCFKTKERAKEVLDKIRFLLKLERLHDIYCPNYTPDWEEDNNTYRYFVYYDNANGVYYVTRQINAIFPSTVYFPTEKIAQKVCDILNREEQNSESNA